MDISDYMESLSVTENLFKEIRFVPSGSIPEWIIKLLLKGGAKQELEISDFTTHLITGEDPDENDIELMKDVYLKPMVNYRWVVLSTKCGKKLPISGFQSDPNQLFSRVTACLSSLSKKDALSIWGMITFYGGECTLSLNDACSHLITGHPQCKKYIDVLGKEDAILPVTPDWVYDTILEQERKDEALYHPKLLCLPKPQLPPEPAPVSQVEEKAPSEKDAAQTPTGTPLTAKIISEPIKNNEKMSVFSTLDFSDEDEDDKKAGSSLLDQLKSTTPSINKKLPIPTTVSTNQLPTPEPVKSSPVVCTPANVSTINSVTNTSTPIQTNPIDQMSIPVSDVSKPQTPQSTLPLVRLPVTTIGITPNNNTTAGHKVITTVNPMNVRPEMRTTTQVTQFSSNLVQRPSSPNTIANIRTMQVTTSQMVPRPSGPTQVISRPSIPTTQVVNRNVLLQQQMNIRSTSPQIVPPNKTITNQMVNRTSPQLINRTSPQLINRTSPQLINRTSPQMLNRNTPSPLLTSRNTPPIRTPPPPNQVISRTTPPGSIPQTLNQNMPQTIIGNRIGTTAQVMTKTTSPGGMIVNRVVNTAIASQVNNRTTSPTILQTQIINRNTPPGTLITNRNTPPNQTVTQIQTGINQPGVQIHKAQIGVSTSDNPQTTTGIIDNNAATNASQSSVAENPTQTEQIIQNQVSVQNQSGAPCHILHIARQPGTQVQQTHIVGGQQSIFQTVPVGTVGIRAGSQPSNLPQGIQNIPHTVAIPGAVVRLPQGVTPQQLQMMSQEERHRFLQQLHQEQQQRGKPRAGKPATVQYKTQSQIRYPAVRVQQPGAPGTPGTHQTVTWPSTIGQGVARPTIVNGNVQATYQQPQLRTQTPTSQTQVWTSPQGQQFASGQSPTTEVVTGQQPGWQQQVQGQPQPQVQGQPQQVQGQPQQVQGQPQPQPGQPQAGTIQTQQGVPQPQGTPVQQTQTLMPQHLQQLQLQIQNLCLQFPNLTRQEAQQLIQTIPAHLRELQQKDNAQCQEYLSQLDNKERQVVTFFHVKRTQHQMLQQRQLLQQQQQQQQQKVGVGTPQQSPTAWQQQQQQGQPGQFPPMSPHNRQIPGRPLPPGYGAQGGVVSPGQGSPHVVAAGGQPTPHASPLASPHGHSPIQRGPGGEQVMIYQRRTLANITGNVTNNIVRTAGPGQTVVAGPQGGVGFIACSSAYPRTGPPGHPAAATTAMAPATPHYPRPHLFGHDSNMLLPRELCLVGCVFYIADYHADLLPEVVQSIAKEIQQHGGEVVPIYDSVKVTHFLCKNQKSPVFQQAVRENKRCITIYWLKDLLKRGKLAPPWKAIHLPTPFGNNNAPCKDLIVSISGFENEERQIIKHMLSLVGAKYSGSFSTMNNLLICKKFEGQRMSKVSKAREWKKPVVNGVWLSEVLLGQNTPPLVYYGTKYQHYVEDPLRIDPSLASHLFNAWKLPITVSKESVEKAKAIREMPHSRKRKTEVESDQDSKRSRLDPQGQVVSNTNVSLHGSLNNPNGPRLNSLGGTPTLTGIRGPLTIINKELPPESLRPRVMLSHMKNKEEIERKILELGGQLAGTSTEVTHLVMGSSTATRTVKFLCAMSCAKHIVSQQWILQSHSQSRFLPEENFTVEMPEFESLFCFNLKESLKKPNRRQLFSGKTFYLTPSVTPGRTWLREIIECAGGTVENVRRRLKNIKERNKDSTQYIVIGTDADVHLVKDLINENIVVYDSEFVMVSILKQEIDYSLVFRDSSRDEE